MRAAAAFVLGAAAAAAVAVVLAGSVSQWALGPEPRLTWKEAETRAPTPAEVTNCRDRQRRARVEHARLLPTSERAHYWRATRRAERRRLAEYGDICLYETRAAP